MRGGATPRNLPRRSSAAAVAVPNPTAVGRKRRAKTRRFFMSRDTPSHCSLFFFFHSVGERRRSFVHTKREKKNKTGSLSLSLCRSNKCSARFLSFAIPARPPRYGGGGHGGMLLLAAGGGFPSSNSSSSSVPNVTPPSSSSMTNPPPSAAGTGVGAVGTTAASL